MRKPIVEDLVTLMTISSSSLLVRPAFMIPTKLYGFLVDWVKETWTSLRAPAVARVLRNCSRVASRDASLDWATAGGAKGMDMVPTPAAKRRASRRADRFMRETPETARGRRKIVAIL